MKVWLFSALLLITAARSEGPAWREFPAVGVSIVVAADADALAVPALSRVLDEALGELHSRPGLHGCSPLQFVIHPDLESFLATVGGSWHQLAVADVSSCRIDAQRIQVLNMHGGLERTVRHELFHLFQPAGWERWRAEGEAQRFAGENPRANVLPGVTPAELDALLAAPPDEQLRLRAMATALSWVLLGR